MLLNADRGEVQKGSAETFFRKVKFWKEDAEGDAPPVFVGISVINHVKYHVSFAEFHISYAKFKLKSVTIYADKSREIFFVVFEIYVYFFLHDFKLVVDSNLCVLFPFLYFNRM